MTTDPINYCKTCGKSMFFWYTAPEIGVVAHPPLFCSEACKRAYLRVLKEDKKTDSGFDLSTMKLSVDNLTPRKKTVTSMISGEITLEELLDVLNKNRVHVLPGDYHKYIQSEQWSLKSQAMRKYFKTCAICHSTKKLCVHHKHYDTVGREGLQDLTVLCGDHHWEYEEKRIKAKEEKKNEKA
jgi:hypothetical protein